MRKRLLFISIFMFFLMMILGCGQTKSDVPIFIMMSNGVNGNNPSLQLERSLQMKIGETPKIKVDVSLDFSKVKLNFEIIKGDHTIFIVPQAQFLSFAMGGSLVKLDELFNPNDYSDGVVEIKVDDSSKQGKSEKHVYGIPIENSKWLEEYGYSSKNLIAFVHPKAKDIDKAMQVLKKISEK
jgi:hypothetical protein